VWSLRCLDQTEEYDVFLLNTLVGACGEVRQKVSHISFFSIKSRATESTGKISEPKSKWSRLPLPYLPPVVRRPLRVEQNHSFKDSRNGRHPVVLAKGHASSSS